MQLLDCVHTFRAAGTTSTTNMLNCCFVFFGGADNVSSKLTIGLGSIDNIARGCVASDVALDVCALHINYQWRAR